MHNKMNIAKLMYHRWEEEPISGIDKGYNGTFAIFFYGCNMRCVYCQNSKISRVKIDKNLYSIEELSEEIIKSEKNNAASVSFITGALYVDQIIETIKLAKEKGLTLPIVYNSSGYETVSQIKKLDGLIDIYLPDFKYFDNELGKKYSKVPNYVDVAKRCIDEMYRQIENKKFEKEQKIEPMLIIRNLILPNNTANSMSIIKYLFEKYGDKVYLSIMSQYTPILTNEDIKKFPELCRKLTKREYYKVINYALQIGVKNAFIQEGDVAKESFIPDF